MARSAFVKPKWSPAALCISSLAMPRNEQFSGRWNCVNLWNQHFGHNLPNERQYSNSAYDVDYNKRIEVLNTWWRWGRGELQCVNLIASTARAIEALLKNSQYLYYDGSAVVLCTTSMRQWIEWEDGESLSKCQSTISTTRPRNVMVSGATRHQARHGRVAHRWQAQFEYTWSA